MCRRGYTLEEATKAVHAARPWICPNEGFRLQLRELERLACDLTEWRAWRHLWWKLSKDNNNGE